MTFVDKDVLSSITDGSYEMTVSSVETAASGVLESQMSVFATFDGVAYGTSGEDIYKIVYENEDGEMVATVELADVPTVDEASLEAYVGSRLGEMIDRKGVHGSIGGLEARVPRTRYAKIGSERISDFEVELRESFDIVVRLVAGMVDECQQLVFDDDDETGIDLDSLRDSLVTESSMIADLGTRTARLARMEHLVELAQLHDDLSDRAGAALVVNEFLSRKADKKTTQE
jgi:hypothetical protein